MTDQGMVPGRSYFSARKEIRVKNRIRRLRLATGRPVMPAADHVAALLTVLLEVRELDEVYGWWDRSAVLLGHGPSGRVYRVRAGRVEADWEVPYVVRVTSNGRAGTGEAPGGADRAVGHTESESAGADDDAVSGSAGAGDAGAGGRGAGADEGAGEDRGRRGLDRADSQAEQVDR